MDAQIWTDQAGRICVSGEVGFINAEKLSLDGEQLIATMPRICTVDLSGIRYASSVMLAVMVGWLRHAAACDVALAFQNIPGQLMQVARVSGLDAVLPISMSSQ